MMTSLECIALSLSVPRPVVITAADIISGLKCPPEPRLSGLMDSFFTEISKTRIAEAVAEGHFRYIDLVEAANAYGLGETKTAIWSREMVSV